MSTTTEGPEEFDPEEEEEEEEEDVVSRTLSSSAKWPAKEIEDWVNSGYGSRDHVEKAVMKPVGSKGSSSSELDVGLGAVVAGTGRVGRSEVTRQRGES